MHITLFGASGKVGQLTVGKALAAGHHVTVFVHNTNPYKAHDRLRVVQGTVYNAAIVASAIKDSEAVICALGSWGTSSRDVLSAAMKAIIPAMEAEGIKRLISLTGSAAWAPGDHISTANRLQHRAFQFIAEAIINDAETHLELLNASSLDWTVLRSSVMTGSSRSDYMLDTQLPKAWEFTPRAAVAQALVDQLERDGHLRQAPHIHPA